MNHESNGQPYNPYREAYEAGPFTNNPKVQPHEESAVESDRQTASILGYDERDTEVFITNRLKLRRTAEYIKQKEQLRAGENVSIILNPALKREYDRQQSQTAGRDEPRDYGPNEDRDLWLYEQWQNNCTWDAILAAFRRLRVANGWRVISSVNGVRTRAKKYAEFHNLPFRNGRAGRPKREK